jgi:hypothetical protein
VSERQIVEAARRYARAVVEHSNADRPALELLLEREAAEHDLIVAAGECCPYCDEDSGCPGPIVNTRPL